MHTIHRVYIGARNTLHHKFLPKDENEINKILKSYLKGWTITKAVGVWEGKPEETIILTVVQTPKNQTGWGNGLDEAVAKIANYLKQYAIVWESNGTAILVPTVRVPKPAIVPLPPRVVVKRKPKLKVKAAVRTS